MEKEREIFPSLPFSILIKKYKNDNNEKKWMVMKYKFCVQCTHGALENLVATMVDDVRGSVYHSHMKTLSVKESKILLRF